MVKNTPPVITMMVDRKYCPMCPETQAREKLPNRSFDGRLNGLLRISRSSLNADITAHSSGAITSTAHSSRNACEKTLSTPPDSPKRSSRTAADPDGTGGLGPVAGVVLVDVAILAPLQLDGFAAGDP